MGNLLELALIGGYGLAWRRVSRQRVDLHTAAIERRWPGRGAPCSLRIPCDEWIVAGGRGWILVLSIGSPRRGPL